MAFNKLETRALTGLAVLYASRMMGLFMVFPILTLYGYSLTGANAQTLGMALGIYGLTQALLQIPFGAASDRFGRKKLIFIGLLIFLAGSLMAALASNVYQLIIGRALQGAGAISSVILALLADYTRESQRSKAMAVIGAVIGGSFVVAVVLGPFIAGWVGLNGLFWFIAALALIGLLVLALLPEVPENSAPNERRIRRDLLSSVFANREVMLLSLGIGMLHLTMTALFVALPNILVAYGLTENQLGAVYAPTMLLGFIGMIPLMIKAERGLLHVRYLRLAALLAVAALLIIGLVAHAWLVAVALMIFFIGFNFSEASLPSLLSRKVGVESRGTAMGVFSTCQFLGAAVGGIAGGWLFSTGSLWPLVMMGVVVQMIWVLLLSAVEPLAEQEVTAA
ncbi:MFS transporter [Reinekea marinisedimentorum]|uniref:Putative MFS family arabinose efflux permease n=1 Tax=Reinekea marinisedimentorum TaxID=230495 RepID=A0A4R3I488_9GAMM|nr:MFS transporter [Reinekea marinisedimentorum]TCS40685.1 putative MFS family arabinose efflux permease [Reinekea marinisedimentorum]